MLLTVDHVLLVYDVTRHPCFFSAFSISPYVPSSSHREYFVLIVFESSCRTFPSGDAGWLSLLAQFVLVPPFFLRSGAFTASRCDFQRVA